MFQVVVTMPFGFLSDHAPALCGGFALQGEADVLYLSCPLRGLRPGRDLCLAAGSRPGRVCVVVVDLRLLVALALDLPGESLSPCVADDLRLPVALGALPVALCPGAYDAIKRRFASILPHYPTPCAGAKSCAMAASAASQVAGSSASSPARLFSRNRRALTLISGSAVVCSISAIRAV